MKTSQKQMCTIMNECGPVSSPDMSLLVNSFIPHKRTILEHLVLDLYFVPLLLLLETWMNKLKTGR